MKNLLNRVSKFTLAIMFFMMSAVIMAADGDTEKPSILHGILPVVVAILAGVYEVIVRVIPSVGNYSWIAKILDILVWISDFLNRKSKKK
jgi:hypothetical protein